MANIYATWNPADKNASISLSGGDLIASHDGSVSFSSVRSTIGKSSGKWYWEITDTADDGAFGMFVGVANSSASLANNIQIGYDINGWGYANRSGGGASKYNNNSRTVYGATYTTGDVIGVALDMDNGTVEMYVNNVSQGVMYTGLTGTIYAGISTPQSSSVATANFGATTMAYTAPTGFNQGLYDAGASTSSGFFMCN